MSISSDLLLLSQLEAAVENFVVIERRLEALRGTMRYTSGVLVLSAVLFFWAAIELKTDTDSSTSEETPHSSTHCADSLQ